MDRRENGIEPYRKIHSPFFNLIAHMRNATRRLIIKQFGLYHYHRTSITFLSTKNLSSIFLDDARQ